MINTIILLINKNFANKIKHSIYNEYDYKNKFLISKNSMDTKLQKEVVKRYFLKKWIYLVINMNATSSSKYYTHDIDKKGNLISKYFTKPTEQLSKQ
jgi:hypothetical protein